MGAVAEAMVEGIEDQVALDLRHGPSHEAAGGGLRDLGGPRRRPLGGDRLALRREDRLGADRVARGQQHRPVQGVLQLADVAAPGVLQHQRLGLRGERARGHAVHRGVFPGEMGGEFQDVGRPLAQRRQPQGDDVEPVEQILAERALADLLHEVAVRGRQHADVDPHRGGAADPVDHPLLQGPQQLRLQAHIHLGDLVEQQRAAVGLLEPADAPGHGAGERPLLVAEQLGFEQGLGDRRAVDRDEGLARPVGLLVDVAGQHLLAGAALAGDQHRGLGAGDLFGELDHPLHGRIAPDEGGAVGGDRLQHRGDHLGIGRERDVFLGAGPDRRHGGLGVGRDPAGDHRGADPLRLQGRDEVADRQARRRS